jgi:PhzF family phenazine biosynthesis protein
MPVLEFRQVDVFTETPLRGNALAVVLDADELEGETMQAVAAETNLSETAFVMRPTVLPRPTGPQADYKIRIFTPTMELPIAGHPSVGTAFTLLSEGRFGAVGDGLTVHQETGIGVLPIAIRPTESGPLITMTQGEPQLFGRFDDLDRLAASLGCSVSGIAPSGHGPRVASTGLRQLMVPLSDLATLSSLKPDLSALAAIERQAEVTGISAFVQESPSVAKVRFFSPISGIVEDPATGSAAGALGAYLASESLLNVRDGQANFTATQGIEIGRPSRIEVTVDVASGNPTRVQVGGHSVTVLRGRLSI